MEEKTFSHVANVLSQVKERISRLFMDEDKAAVERYMRNESLIRLCSTPVVLENEGRRVIAIAPYSSHPDDWYLRVVLVETMDQYVVWMENVVDTMRQASEGKDALSTFEGSYFPKTKEGFHEALRKFYEKGRK